MTAGLPETAPIVPRSFEQTTKSGAAASGARESPEKYFGGRGGGLFPFQGFRGRSAPLLAAAWKAS